MMVPPEAERPLGAALIQVTSGINHNKYKHSTINLCHVMLLVAALFWPHHGALCALRLTCNRISIKPLLSCFLNRKRSIGTESLFARPIHWMIQLTKNADNGSEPTCQLTTPLENIHSHRVFSFSFF